MLAFNTEYVKHDLNAVKEIEPVQCTEWFILSQIDLHRHIIFTNKLTCKWYFEESFSQVMFFVV